MAQLIKLTDYISRYEWNIYRYPTQFIRLKKDNWNKLYQMWLDQKENGLEEVYVPNVEPSLLSKLKRRLKRENEIETEEHIRSHDKLPLTEIELKHYFLDKLFPFQLKWATSTVTDVSFVDPVYYSDHHLKFFLQRFPDIYLVMYNPVFQIKKAVVDGQIIFISPIGIEIISLLETDPNSSIYADGDRTWVIRGHSREKTIINPLISLKRTEQIVRNILLSGELDFPIQKTVISRTNQMIYTREPYRTNLIDTFSFEKWFENKRKQVSPLKNKQLKAADLLLKHCATTAVKRPEWDEDDDSFDTENEEGQNI